MKFAKYWQKIDLNLTQQLFGKSKISVWGASNDSADAAMSAAKSRAEKLKTFIASGFKDRTDYEYWNGFIKEEIVEEVKSDNGTVLAVLTRNSYGATVLNTESVLFGDIDVDMTAVGLMDRIFASFGKQKKDKPYYLEKIKNYQMKHPELSIKVYETFAGLRFAVTNKLYSPEEPQVKHMFNQLDVDPLYMRLCKQQICFRARLSPKPWRINMARPGSRFPRASEQQQKDFDLWLKNYSLASARITTAKLLASFGSAKMHADVESVLKIHDRYACKNSSELG